MASFGFSVEPGKPGLGGNLGGPRSGLMNLGGFT